MHASGVRPLPLAPWPRWAAWSYYSSCAPLGIVRRFGRVSVPFTNEQCRIQERKVENRKSPYLEVISSLQ